MLYESGFYKFDATSPLLYAKSFVKAPDYTLLVENKDDYDYPVSGWYWFESLQDACTHFGLNINLYTIPTTETETQ